MPKELHIHDVLKEIFTRELNEIKRCLDQSQNSDARVRVVKLMDELQSCKFLSDGTIVCG